MYHSKHYVMKGSIEAVAHLKDNASRDHMHVRQNMYVQCTDVHLKDNASRAASQPAFFQNAYDNKALKAHPQATITEAHPQAMIKERHALKLWQSTWAAKPNPDFTGTYHAIWPKVWVYDALWANEHFVASECKSQRATSLSAAPLDISFRNSCPNTLIWALKYGTSHPCRQVHAPRHTATPGPRNDTQYRQHMDGAVMGHSQRLGVSTRGTHTRVNSHTHSQAHQVVHTCQPGAWLWP
eukprot:1162066-Pelagomonas_calceolata.AAC.6